MQESRSGHRDQSIKSWRHGPVQAFTRMAVDAFKERNSKSDLQMILLALQINVKWYVFL
jgi:uncharacterized phage-associated protein